MRKACSIILFYSWTKEYTFYLPWHEILSETPNPTLSRNRESEPGRFKCHSCLLCHINYFVVNSTKQMCRLMGIFHLTFQAMWDDAVLEIPQVPLYPINSTGNKSCLLHLNFIIQWGETNRGLHFLQFKLS